MTDCSVFPGSVMRPSRVSGISIRFRMLSQSYRQVTHVLLTRPPLTLSRRTRSARLACIRHAASVRPEPGSNSPNWCLKCSLLFIAFSLIPKDLRGSYYSLFSFQRTIFSFVSAVCLIGDLDNISHTPNYMQVLFSLFVKKFLY